MPTIATAGTLLALTMAGAIAWGLSRSPLDTPQRLWWGRVLAMLPSVVLLVSFLTEMRLMLVTVVLALGIAYFLLAFVGVERVVRRPGSVSVGGLLGVVTIVGLLYVFGSLLQVRLNFQKDPQGGILQGLNFDTVMEFIKSQALMVGVIGAALAMPWFRAELVSRSQRWKAARRVSRPGARSGRPGWVRAGLGWVQQRPGAKLIGAIILLQLGFLAPLFAPAKSGAHLTFFGLATSEWLRPILLLVFAQFLTRYHRHLRIGLLARREPDAIVAFLGAFLLSGIAVIGVMRSDFGTLVPLVFAGPAMIFALNQESRTRWLRSLDYDDPVASNPLSGRKARKATRIIVPVLVGLFLMAPYLAIPDFKGRIEPWKDPWQFAWVPDCTPVSQVPDWIAPGETYTARVPEGYEACRQVQGDVLDSSKSQMARALTAIDGGGLWGRGLADSEVRALPVLDSDFVLASVWSKLGGLVVILAALLTIMLGYLLELRLTRLTWQGKPDSKSDRIRLYAAGLGWAITGQAIYVLAATTNLVFHSGVPFPFLARGGQAMAGLALGIVLLVWQAREVAVEAGPVPARAAGAGRTRVPLGRRATGAVLRNLGLGGAVVICAAALIAGTVFPFAAKTGWSPDEGLTKRPSAEGSRNSYEDVQKQLRSRGPSPVVLMAGEPALALNRATGAWAVGDGMAVAVDPQMMFGVLKTSNGGSKGLLEGAAEDVLNTRVNRTFSDRLTPPVELPDEIALTIDPALQRTVAQAARTPIQGESRLPAGVVVLDAGTGAIRALSSAPDELDLRLLRASEAEVKAWNVKNVRDRDDRGWGEIVDAQTIRNPADVDCTKRGVKCARILAQPASQTALNQPYLRTYVGGSEAFDLPKPTQNRAVGRRYNLGSAFKVVIAAAYLENGGKAHDLIKSPPYVEVGGRRIGVLCRGTVEGRITLADALKVSCNSAFIQLARDLGWPQIAKVAQRLGFTPVDSANDKGAELLWPALSQIPRTADYQSVGTYALGGDIVTGTPYQMAALMGAIANGGTYNEPSLVARSPAADGADTNHQDKKAALEASTTAQLQDALSEVTGEGGTLADVASPAGVRFFGKSGTHVARPEAMSGNYTSRYFWVVGAAEKTNGGGQPISFAVVVEGHDAKLGHDQVRAITRAILDTYAAQGR